ncbi:hypothetical protein PFISCL1PPCAC_13142, partial [Pristionchus fissidentatus]
MSSSLIIAAFASMVYMVAAQCGKSNHPNCASWNNTVQFCTSTARTLEMRQQYCPFYCTNLNCPKPTNPTTPPTDANANCAAWAAKADATSFCVNPAYTVAMKTLYCASTCAFEIKPTADCAFYTVTGTAMKRGTPSNRTATPGTAVPSGAVGTTTTLSRAFAASGCTVRLFAAAAPPTPINPTTAFAGSATTQFFTVAAAQNGALSYTCTCA